jgi:hypothetical protein
MGQGGMAHKPAAGLAAGLVCSSSTAQCAHGSTFGSLSLAGVAPFVWQGNCHP